MSTFVFQTTNDTHKMHSGPYRFLFAAAAISLPAILNAAPLSPRQAAERAINAYTDTKMRIKGVVSPDDLMLVHTAKTGNDACFYIFNVPSGGYSVVAADDRIPAILGYSDDGHFDPQQMPDNMRWWLGQYEQEIARFLANPRSNASASTNRPVRTPVEPLLTTRWNQSEPFNDDCPTDPQTGRKSVTGCVATAMAQVMKHHNWPPQAKGERNHYSFEGHAYDWGNMLDVYTQNSYNSTQASAVSLLMRDCGISVDMNYSSSASGAQTNSVGYALTEYFGYDPGLRLHLRWSYPLDEWEDLIYEEMTAGRPVYYSGAGTGGHAFVCDGYRGSGYFHFNWGWGGAQDGWFRLFALNPTAGGIGSSDGGYNSQQQIFTHVMPDTGKDNPRQVLLATDGGYSGKIEDDTLTIFFLDNNNEEKGAFNYLAYTENLEISFRWESVSNPGYVHIDEPFQHALEPFHGFGTLYTSDVLAVPDGEYKVTVVYRDADRKGEWNILRGCNDMPQWTLVTVADEKPVAVSTPQPADGANLILSRLELSTKNPVAFAPQGIKATLCNAGEMDFDGYNLTLIAVDKENPEKTYRIGWTYHYRLPAQRSDVVEFTMEEASIPDMELKPGEYDIHLEVQHDIMEGTIPVEFIEPENDGSESEYDIRFYDAYPNFTAAADLTSVSISRSGNLTDEEADNGQMAIQLVYAETKDVALEFVYNARYFASGQRTSRFSFPASDKITPGYYYWRLCYRPNEGEPRIIKGLFPVRIHDGHFEGTADGRPVFYNRVPSKDGIAAEIVEPFDAYRFSGDVAIPSEIDSYPIVAIDPSLFAFNRDITSITLPQSIGILPAQFYCSENLKTINIPGDTPAFFSPAAFAPGMAQEVELNVASGAANIFKRTPGWEDLRMSAWEIKTYGDDVKLHGIATDPATGKHYSPYYVSRYETVSFSVEHNTGEALFVSYSIDGGEKQSAIETGGIYSFPALNGRNGLITVTSGAGIGSLRGNDETHEDVYTPTGILVGRAMTPQEIKNLPKGIYIASGRKFSVR